MALFTNNANISLPMAVMLATDDYDFTPSKASISVTSLIDSPRKVILSRRLAATGELRPEELANLIPSRLGNAIHAAVERAWLNPYEALKAMGVPKKARDKLKVNPTQWGEGDLCVWTELRSEREIEDWIVSGQGDLILDGAIHDVKSTGIFAYTSGSNNKKYRLQLSMYRWLNPDKVTKDMGYIEYYFKDWDKLESGYKPNYPPFPIYQQPIPLLSLGETELFIRDRIQTLKKYADAPEPELPECTDEDLWRDKPKWQYFGSPTNKKASKNFATELEAMQWRNAKGKGEVRYQPAIAKACAYCQCRYGCSQYANLLAANLVKVL